MTMRGLSATTSEGSSSGASQRSFIALSRALENPVSQACSKRGRPAVGGCFSQEFGLIPRTGHTREPEPTHNELKHFLPGILPGVRSVAKSELPWPRTRVAPVPHGPAIFLRRHSSAPLLGYFFSSSFFRTSSARHSVRELDARAHVLTSSLFLPSSVHDVAPRPRSLRRCRFRYASPARGGACACSRDEPAASVAAHHGGSGWWLR